MNDADCIVKALQELGYTAEVHDKAKNLEGWHGDQRKQKANIIVKRQNINSAANDVGFLRKADGTFEMIISSFDKHASHGKKFTQELLQLYGKHKTLKQAAQMGYTVRSQSVDNEGRMKIRIMTR
jgi:hypothetical protein